jgi:hypothetical protein
VNNTITVFCKPYVAQYLRSYYPHPTNSQIVKLPRKSILQQTFLNALCKNFHRSSDYNLKVFTEKVEFAVRKNDLHQHGHTISIAQHYHINAVFEEKLKNELFYIITSIRSHGQSLKQAIHHYQMFCGFTEELFSYEAIAKAYQRASEQSKDISDEIKISCTSVLTSSHHQINSPSK